MISYALPSEHWTEEALRAISTPRYVGLPALNSPLAIKLVLDALQTLPVKTQQGLLDHTRILLELDTKILGVEGAFQLLDSPRLVELDLNSQRLFRLDRVDSQVVSRSVGATNTFDPAV